MFKRIFIVGLLSAAAYLVYRTFAVKDYSAEAVTVANSVNEILLALGATDADVAGQYRRQMSDKGARWIEFTKRLRIPLDEKAEAALGDLSSRIGRNFEKRAVPGGYEIHIKSGDRTYYTLFFLTKASPRSVSVSRRAIIVIDDLGYNLKDVESFLVLGIPVTYAVLPRERNSQKTAAMLRRRGADYMVHFPMEPDDPMTNPGRAAVLVSMDAAEISRRFDNAVKTVPGAFGVSNHMGSKFTRSAEKMKIFLELVKKNRMVYFDSHTSPKSVVSSVAKDLGMRVMVNQIFLDNDDSREAIDKQLELLLQKSRKKNVTIAIGHVHKKHLAPAIKDYLPRFKEAGVEFVSLRELYESSGPSVK